MAEVARDDITAGMQTMTMKAFEWYSKTAGGEWQGFELAIATELEAAYARKDDSYTYTRDNRNSKLRDGDPDELHYRITFSNMKQICVEYPSRERVVRRGGGIDVELTPAQKSAIQIVEANARKSAGPTAVELEKQLGGSAKGLQSFISWITRAPMIIHTKFNLHLEEGGQLIDAFAASETYKNMFETGHGRGCTNMAARMGWERRLFSGAYGTLEKGVPFKERPKYGTLNLTDHPMGVLRATCYGKSFMQLKESVRWRCTFTSKDSCNSDAQPATPRVAAHVASHLDAVSVKMAAAHDGSGSLNQYIEIQIHGPVRFAHDIEKIVADKDMDLDVRNKVQAFARKNGIALEFRGMFEAVSDKDYDRTH